MFVGNTDIQGLLVVHIIGPHATEMIAEAALARLLDSRLHELAIAIQPQAANCEP